MAYWGMTRDGSRLAKATIEVETGVTAICSFQTFM
jgi:hypothetical protein